jgi:uncharacterized BrkB/YihY/UPF0761 family membrane protein
VVQAVAIGFTVGFALFIMSALVLMLFPRIGSAVAGCLGLGSVFTIAWNAGSVPLVIFFVLAAIQLVYYLAPGGDQEWSWLWHRLLGGSEAGSWAVPKRERQSVADCSMSR